PSGTATMIQLSTAGAGSGLLLTGMVNVVVAASVTVVCIMVNTTTPTPVVAVSTTTATAHTHPPPFSFSSGRRERVFRSRFGSSALFARGGSVSASALAARRATGTSAVGFFGGGVSVAFRRAVSTGTLAQHVGHWILPEVESVETEL